jgi:long-chain acyl-CoA synthetase
MGHPGVANCAAIGVPDSRTGEAVKLFVVPRATGLDIEELKQFCKANLTGYKVPHQIVLRESLPMTAVGKILRRELREKG